MSLSQQATDQIMMIRPVSFGFNEQTAGSNAFQSQSTELPPEEIASRAVEEFDEFVRLLRAEGVEVTVIQDTAEPHTPDSIFPNNWVSFHADGKIILYPMEAPNRRQERNAKTLEIISAVYAHPNVIDWSPPEMEGRYLEGTGSLILDRINRIAYTCYSSRSDPRLFDDWCREFGWRGIGFCAEDESGQAIYHSNVLMALGADFAVICLDAIADTVERRTVCEALETSGHTLFPISYSQMNAFAGNMLQLRNREGQSLIAMSRRAHESLTPEQLAGLERFGKLLVIPLDVIETYGGGSVRCMMAEVFTDR